MKRIAKEVSSTTTIRLSAEEKYILDYLSNQYQTSFEKLINNLLKERYVEEVNRGKSIRAEHRGGEEPPERGTVSRILPRPVSPPPVILRGKKDQRKAQ